MANLGRAILEILVDTSEFFDTLGQLEPRFQDTQRKLQTFGRNESTRERTCIDCGQPADAGEAEYYRRRNWVAPRRCDLCRLTRRSTTAVHTAIHEVT